jgi:hypothetical protein
VRVPAKVRPHGVRAKYVFEKCRCSDCVEANRVYARQRDRHSRRVRYGIEPDVPKFVDATETRDHLAWLRSQGVGLRAVEARSGIGRTALREIILGRRTRILPRTADAVLGVPRSIARPGALVDSTEARAMVDDLRYLGFRRIAIARALGRADIPASLLKGRPVKRSTADEVRAAWEAMIRTTEHWHGTYAGYAKRSCRCLRCRRSARETARARRSRAA